MSGFYDSGRELFLTAQLNWLTANVSAVLVNVSAPGTVYSANLTTHRTMGNVVTSWSGNVFGAVIAGPVALTSKSATAGIADAANVTFAGVTGDSIEAVILCDYNSGSPANSNLICYIDGVNVTPNSGSITVAWDDGPNKIFKL